MEQLFDVLEVEIASPNKKRVMAVDLPKDEAEAFARIAVIRRGVEHHIYTLETAPSRARLTPG